MRSLEIDHYLWNDESFLVKSVGVIDANLDTVFEVVCIVDRHKRYEWAVLTGDLELIDYVNGHYDVIYGTYDTKYLSQAEKIVAAYGLIGIALLSALELVRAYGGHFAAKICKLYHPLALRIFLIGTHYRSPVNYSSALLEIASERIFYIYQKVQEESDPL